jgi:hypothetical protein
MILPLLLIGSGPSFLSGQQPRSGPPVEAYHEMVRFDLADGSWIDARRPGAPSDLLQVRLTVPIQMRAVKDEVLAFQLLVKGEGTLPISASTSSLAVELFREAGIRVHSASKTAQVHGLGAGLYPDALIPTSTIALERGRAVVWVDVFVPPRVQAGLHRFELSIGEARVPVEITVLDQTLPQRDVAKIGAVNFGSLLMRGKRDRAAELAWMQMGHAHGLSIEMMRAVPQRLGDAIHWEGWAEQVEPYLDGSAFTAHYGYRGPTNGPGSRRSRSTRKTQRPSMRARRMMRRSTGASSSRARTVAIPGQ